MLYKKYHRNFVRQFKKGVKFKIFSEETVMKEPYYKENCDYDDGTRTNGCICITGSKHGWWVLVFPGGKIDNRRTKIIG